MTTPVATPQNGDELEELFHDKPRLKAALEDGSFPGMVKNYVEKSLSAAAGGEELQKRFDEQVQTGLQGFMRDQLDRYGARAPEGWRPGAPAAGGSRRSQALSRSRLRNAAASFERHHLFSPKAVGGALEDAEYSDNLRQFIWATIKGESIAAQNGDQELGRKLLSLKGTLAKLDEIFPGHKTAPEDYAW